MASPLTLRLDAKTRKRIERIARRKQLSTSEVLRQAIEAWADRQEPVTSPYDLLSDLVGVVHSGNSGRSEQTSRHFKRLLKARRSRR